MNKKLIIAGFFIIFLLILYSVLKLTITNKVVSNTIPSPTIAVSAQLSPDNNVLGISTTIDFGNGKKVTGMAQAKNAYEALVDLARENKLTVQTKEYPFGIMVEKIDMESNNKTDYWLFFVNGKVGEKAADQYELKAGDIVEWKYTKNAN